MVSEDNLGGRVRLSRGDFIHARTHSMHTYTHKHHTLACVELEQVLESHML